MTIIRLLSLFTLLIVTNSYAQSNSHGLDPKNIDTSIAACDDFYQYANGNWLKNNPIPDEYSRWSVGNEVRERNFILLKSILEDAAKQKNVLKGSNLQKIGDFYKNAMDLEKLESQKFSNLHDSFKKIDSMESIDDLQRLVTDFHSESLNFLFRIGVYPDFENSKKLIFYAVQGGLGLPDRDYYLRDDKESIELQSNYKKHVATMFRLVGDSETQSNKNAEAILQMETRLAKASLSAVELRNISNYYRIRDLRAAHLETTNFNWENYFIELNKPELTEFSFAHPGFFAEVNKMLEDTAMDHWRAYFRWHLINAAAPYLHHEVAIENFKFFQKTLRGSLKQLPRWKRVLAQINNSLGEALGELYVEEAFPQSYKMKANVMIESLREVIKARIDKLDWMNDETRNKALEKLATFQAKIGYPDKWRDYSGLNIKNQSYLGNVRRANRFEMQRQLKQVGQDVDRNEWGMAPQTVNAYYSPLLNEIVFPAAILQPPFFDGKIDDAINYGAMGGVIGHEFLHGFDDQGSRFDAQGNMVNWWTDRDRKEFISRTQVLIMQYNNYIAIDELHVNGELTLGENIGDFGGLTVAYHAFKNSIAEQKVKNKDGFTAEQRFFLSWAQSWRANYRPEALKLLVNTNPHSPSKFRTNGPLSNMPEFYQAFKCKSGDAMYREEKDRANIW